MTADRLEELVVGFTSKWEDDWKGVSTPDLIGFWSDSFKLIDKVVQHNKYKLATSTEVVSAVMGAGKSATLVHYLQNTDVKALVVVELKKTCDKRAKEVGTGAIAIHSDNDNTLADVDTNRVVFITHSKLGILMRSEIADEFFDKFDLIAIDESINTYQHIDLQLTDLQYIQTIGRDYLNLDYMGFLDFHINRLKSMDVNDQVPFRKSNEELSHIMDWKRLAVDLEPILDTNIPDKKKIKNLLVKIQDLSKSGRVKIVSYTTAGFKKHLDVVIDFFPDKVSKIIFDGTAEVNETYELINSTIGDLHIHNYKGLRDYSNAELKLYTINVGQSALTVGKKRTVSQIKEQLTTFINNLKELYTPEDKLLLVVHKKNILLGTDTEDKTKGFLYKALQVACKDKTFEFSLDDDIHTMPNWNVIHWGGETVGSNSYSSYTKVVLYGLNIWSDNAYRAHYNSTLSAKSKLVYNPIESLKGSLLSVDILQAICRGSIRKSIDSQGNCELGTEVVVCLPSTSKVQADTIKENILLVLPHIQVTKFKYKKHVSTVTKALRGKIQTTIEALEELRERGIVEIPPKYIMYQEGEDTTLVLDKSQKGAFPYKEKPYRKKEPVEIIRPFSKTAYKSLLNSTNKQVVLEELGKVGWYSVPITKEVRLATGSSNIVKDMYVYREVGTFTSTLPTEDKFGNEF